MLSDDELGFVLHYRLRKETSGVVPSIQEVESTADVANIFELSISERIIIERLCASIGTNL